MNPISISILGACVLRDLFAFCDNEGIFFVNGFIQENNPLSLGSKSPLVSKLKSEQMDEKTRKDFFADEHNFSISCMLFDINKDLTDLSKSGAKSSYLIIDVSCLRFNLLKVKSDDKDRGVFVTNQPSKAWGRLREKLVEYNFVRGYLEEQDVLSFSDEEFEKYMDEYVRKIKEVYEEDEIIVIDVREVEWYLDKTKSFCYYSPQIAELHNRRISRGYDYLKNKLKRAYFVDFLSCAIGDEKHKWGKHPLHYVKECYDYMYRSIMEIVYCDNRCELERKFELIKQEYTNKIRYKYPIGFINEPSEELAIRTYHNRVMNYDESDGKIYQETRAKNPVWGIIDGGGVALYIPYLKKYVANIADDSKVSLSNEKVLLEIIKHFNPQGGNFSIKCGDKILSARSDGSFSLQNNDKEWEHFMMNNLIPLGGDKRHCGVKKSIGTLLSYHNTVMFWNHDDLINAVSNKMTEDFLPVYFIVLDNNHCNFAAIFGGRINYIYYDDGWRIGEQKIDFEYITDDNGFVSISSDSTYLSARVNGEISFVSQCMEWEKFRMV